MYEILIIIFLILLFYYFNKTDTVEHLALQKVQRGLVTTKRSGTDNVTTFSNYSSQCFGGDGKRKYTAYSPVDNVDIIKNTNDPLHGKPDSVEIINGRQAPVWIKNDATCPIDGIDGPFEPWSSCSVQCGTGSQTRKLTCKRQAANGGKPCSNTVETQSCNTQQCPLDGIEGDFGPWSPCDKTCGTGKQTRTKICIKEAAFGGKPCSKTTETQSCNTQACVIPIDGIDGNFGDWTTCSKPCGGGIQTRTKICLKEAQNGGKPCSRTTETQSCNNQACSIPATTTYPKTMQSDLTTPWNDSGNGNSVYLDRHDINCPNKSALSKFQMANKDGKQIQYQYSCLAAVDFQDAVPNSTPPNDDGGGNTIYFDRHAVMCPTGSAVNEWHLIRPTANKIAFNYKCVPVPGLQKCEEKTTPFNDEGGGNSLYLDRHNVNCDNKMLTSFRLVRNGKGQYQYVYSCCGRETDSTSPTPPPSDLYNNTPTLSCLDAKNKYWEMYPDVKNAGVDAWSHYKQFGKTEDRKWYGGNTCLDDNVYLLKHKTDGKCLDGDGQKWFYSDCNPSNQSQQFKFLKGVQGGYNMQQVSSSKCFDGNGSGVYYGPCQPGNTYQTWITANQNDNLLKHVASAKCLDGNGSALYYGPCDPNNVYQNWIKTPISSSSSVLTAQFIRVNTAGGYLNLNEIQVFSGSTNISKGKTLTSSTPDFDTGFHALSHLVDDNLSTMGATKGAGKEWVLIDFGSENIISKIVIHNRKDCCQGRIVGGFVELLDKNKNTIWTSDRFKSKTGGVVPLDHPDTSGYLVYTINLPNTTVVGSDA